jgi:hypothetical protein
MADNWIPTTTGGRVWLNPVDVSEVTIRDIALGLARMTRYNGQYLQSVPFYSVAEHCTLGSYVAPPPHRLAFHVHDAAEALIGDVTTPLKHQLGEYKAIERQVEDALRLKFAWPDWHNATVKEIDLRMLVAERQQLVNHMNIPWSDCEGIEPAPVHFNCWLPTAAWGAWEDRYRELTDRRY